MRAYVWKNTDVAEVQDMPVPVPEKDQALIRVGVGGICGSDLTIISGKHPRAKAPLILGHEFMGRVERLPEAYSGALRPGQRVTVEPLLACGTCRPCRGGNRHVCRNLRLLGVETHGGFAEFAAAPVNKVFPLADSVSDREGAMIEPLAVAVHGVDAGKPSPGDSIVVFGAGPIGLLCALVARTWGDHRVLLFERDGERIARARNLGLEVVDSSAADPVEAVMDFTGGEGADVTIDAAGVPAVGSLLIPVTGIKGRIVVVALHKSPCEVFFRQLSYGEQTILGTRIYAAGDFARALRLVEEKRIDLSGINSHSFPWSGIQEAFRVARDPSASCKVLVELP